MWTRTLCCSVAMLLLGATTAAAQVTIDSFDCDSAGTYVLSEDLSTAGTGITVSADDVVIRGNGFSITYATSASGSGVLLAGGNRRGLEIDTLNFVEGTAGGPAFSNDSWSISDLSLHDCDITCSAEATVAIRLVDFSTDITGLSILNNTLTLEPTSGTQGDGIAIDNSGTSPLVSGAIGNNTIRLGGTLSSSRPAAINVSGPGDLDIHDNTITIAGPDDNNGILFWAASGHTVRGNQVTMNCFHCRGILVDGGSDGNSYRDNIVDMNTSGSCSGIRVRYGSDNNDFFGNRIDSQDAESGFCLRFGERQDTPPNDDPDNNVFFGNTFVGVSPPVRIENGSSQTSFLDNTIESTDGGIVIDIIVWSAVSPNTIDGLWFSHETLITAGSTVVRISSQPSQEDQFADIVFCASGISASDISDSQSIVGWSVAELPCHDDPMSFDAGVPLGDGGVGADAGVRDAGVRDAGPRVDVGAGDSASGDAGSGGGGGCSAAGARELPVACLALWIVARLRLRIGRVRSRCGRGRG